MTDQGAERPYDIALSFAGEDRKLAEALAQALRKNGVRVFYDEFEKSKLWGKDLYQHLQAVYRDQAKYCLMLISAHYLAKRWTLHELKQAQARAFSETEEYILPIKIDSTQLPGINPTIAYIDATTTDMAAIVRLVVEKLGLSEISLDERLRRTWDGEFIELNYRRVVSYWPAIIEQAQEHKSYTFKVEKARIPYGKEKRYGRMKFAESCRDCAVKLGQLHTSWCVIEECPNCRGQLVACECRTLQDTRTDEDEQELEV